MMTATRRGRGEAGQVSRLYRNLLNVVPTRTLCLPELYATLRVNHLIPHASVVKVTVLIAAWCMALIAQLLSYSYYCSTGSVRPPKLSATTHVKLWSFALPSYYLGYHLAIACKSR